MGIGISLGTAGLACVASIDGGEPESVEGEAGGDEGGKRAVAAPEAGGDAGADAPADAPRDAILDAFCDATWPTTKGGAACGPIEACIDAAAPMVPSCDAIPVGKNGACWLSPTFEVAWCVDGGWQCSNGRVDSTMDCQCWANPPNQTCPP